MAAAEKEGIGSDLEGKAASKLGRACRVAKDSSCRVEQHGDGIGIRHRFVEKVNRLLLREVVN
jgi:hypothetical protein